MTHSSQFQDSRGQPNQRSAGVTQALINDVEFDESRRIRSLQSSYADAVAENQRIKVQLEVERQRVTTLQLQLRDTAMVNHRLTSLLPFVGIAKARKPLTELFGAGGEKIVQRIDAEIVRLACTYYSATLEDFEEALANALTARTKAGGAATTAVSRPTAVLCTNPGGSESTARAEAIIVQNQSMTRDYLLPRGTETR